MSDISGRVLKCGTDGYSMYLEPHSFGAHVRHERLHQMRYITNENCQIVDEMVMNHVREAHKIHKPAYRTCRCLDGYVSSEFAYVDYADAVTIHNLITSALTVFGPFVNSVNEDILARVDKDGEKCACPYARDR